MVFVDLLRVKPFTRKSMLAADSFVEAFIAFNSERKAMNRNWSNQKPNPTLKTKMGNK